MRETGAGGADGVRQPGTRLTERLSDRGTVNLSIFKALQFL